jgi:hypothetical protein
MYGANARLSGMPTGAVVVLLNEKLLNETSFYKPFVDYLQIEYDMVEEWSDAELNEFQDLKLVHEARSRINILRRDYGEAMQLIKRYGQKMPYLHGITQKLFNWAWHTVGTRSFGFFDKPEDSRPTLVPVADLINYNEKSAGAWRDGDGRVVVNSGFQDSFRQGDEIFISYGSETCVISDFVCSKGKPSIFD